MNVSFPSMSPSSYLFGILLLGTDKSELTKSGDTCIPAWSVCQVLALSLFKGGCVISTRYLNVQQGTFPMTDTMVLVWYFPLVYAL